MDLERDYYVRLIPSHNRIKPLFAQVVETMIAGPWFVRRAIKHWPLRFNLEDAVGHQLDILGEWIGISRFLQIQLTGIYFSWDDTPDIGWESGVWQGAFDSDEGLSALGDEDYRRLLYTMIMINHWDGSREQLRAIWERFLPSTVQGFIQDNQDMTLTIGYVGPELVGIQAAIARVGASLVKPMAVRIREYISPPNDGELLTWDAGPFFINGEGQWQQSLIGMGYWCDHAVLRNDDVWVNYPLPFTGWGPGNFPIIHEL